MGFGVDVVARNSKKLQKLDLEGKISGAANVFTLPNLDIFNYENVKKLKNVFRLGPKAQATMVYLKTYYMLCILLDL